MALTMLAQKNQNCTVAARHDTTRNEKLETYYKTTKF